MISLIVYWGSCLLSVFIAKTKQMLGDEKMFVLSSIPLLIITSLRYNVGSDFLSYREIFHDIEKGYQGR